MSSIVFLVFSAAFAVFAALILAGVIISWLRRHNARNAVGKLEQILDKEVRRRGMAEVNPISVRPLSVSMTKEAAEMCGYEFIEFYNRNGSELMRFRRASGTQKATQRDV